MCTRDNTQFDKSNTMRAKHNNNSTVGEQDSWFTAREEFHWSSNIGEREQTYSTITSAAPREWSGHVGAHGKVSQARLFLALQGIQGH